MAQVASLRAVLRHDVTEGPFCVSPGQGWIVEALAHAQVDARELAQGEEFQGTLVVADAEVERLVYIADRLLAPGGCPWDQKQTHETLKKYLLEEAYELCEAIDEGDFEGMREELGDVLLQPVIHAAMTSRDGRYDISDVARGISDKLVRRHPHVFGDVVAEDEATVLRNWDAIKRTEKGDERRSILDGLPKGMPALALAFETSVRAARNGFEWPNLEGVFEKLAEEEAELREALVAGDPEKIRSELGDYLFTVVNIARWNKVDPESALRQMVARFTKRFKHMEAALGGDFQSRTPEEWDTAWRAAKQAVG